MRAALPLRDPKARRRARREREAARATDRASGVNLADFCARMVRESGPRGLMAFARAVMRSEQRTEVT